MNRLPNGIELKYQTNIIEGLESFAGQPHPTKEALDLIGEEGVNYIHETLKLFRETKRRIFGFEDIKVFFHKKQFFKVVGTPYTIEVNPIKDNANEDYTIKISGWNATSYIRRKETLESLAMPLRLTPIEEYNQYKKRQDEWIKMGYDFD